MVATRTTRRRKRRLAAIGFRVLGFRVLGFGLRVEGFRVEGLGFIGV